MTETDAPKSGPTPGPQQGDPVLESPGAALPHRAPAVLLDRIIECSPEQTQVTSVIGPDHPYLPGGSSRAAKEVDGTIALEWFAQAVAVHSAASSDSDGPPARGFVAAVPQLDWTSGFRVGETAHIRVSPEFVHGALARFRGTVHVDGKERATGVVTVAIERSPAQGDV